MSYIGLHGNPPLKAGGNVSPCRFIKISDDSTAVQCSANGDVAVGISADGVRIPPGFVESLGGSITNYHAISGEPIEYFGIGQYALLECGTAWTAGALLMADTDGKGVTATSTNPANAIALTDAAAGELRRVRILGGQPAS